MKIRKQSITGDYVFGGGLNSFHTDSPDGVAQIVSTRLKLFLNEWYLDIDEGTPFMQSILGKYSKDDADTAFRNRVLTTESVTGIESFSSVIDPNKRSLSVEVRINTEFGPSDITIQNYKIY